MSGEMILTHVGLIPTRDAVCRYNWHKGVLRVVGKTLVCDQCRAEKDGDGHYGKHYPKVCDVCHQPYVANGFQQRYCIKHTKAGRNRRAQERRQFRR